jgi:hypothetical protein
MRAAIASLVLAAAIAAPGIVVAAMSSGGHSDFTTTIVSGPVQTLPAGVDSSLPINPKLKSYVDAVVKTFAAHGTLLSVFPGASGGAQAFQFGSAHCAVDIALGSSGHAPALFALFVSQCGTGSIRAGNVTITYSPLSIGPTIRLALAGLPR